MKKEIMDALCMLHSLAKKDTTFTTQDEQFKIVVEYIENLQKENALLLANNNGYFDLKKYLENNYVQKDKIREKMKEIMGYTFTTSEERYCQDYAYDRLKELLEDD